MIVLGLTAIGAIYGWYLDNFSTNENLTYEMVVKSNSIANIELYAFSSEVNNQKIIQYTNEGIDLVKRLQIKGISVTPIERDEDVLASYFDKIENAVMRNDMTDTLYFQTFDIGGHKSAMENKDYILQSVKIKAPETISPSLIQNELIKYLNNLPGVVAEKQKRLTALKAYENVLKQNLSNIDSIMLSKANLNISSGALSGDQLLVNTASRGNVEADLLKYSEALSKKLYGTQKKIADYDGGITVVSNLRFSSEKSSLDNSLLKYTIIAFILALVIILLLEFNRYLSRYEKA